VKHECLVCIVQWGSLCAHLTAPIATDNSHSFQLSLTVLKNFPRNTIIKICEIRWCSETQLSRLARWNDDASSKHVCIQIACYTVTWSTVVIPTIPMKRWLLVTPLKTFFSSGSRALNSLKIWHKCHIRHKKRILWFLICIRNIYIHICDISSNRSM
jgi:hypothetical protein